MIPQALPGKMYQREDFAEVYSEALPLLERHAKEIAHYQDIQLNVAVERYRLADEAGGLRVYTARTGATGALIAYAAFFMAFNPHFKSSLQAVQDVLYVQPEWRGRMVGFRLIRFSENELRKEGVQAVYQHEKIAHPELGKLLLRMGYEAVDTIYAKRLDSPVRIVKG